MLEISTILGGIVAFGTIVYYFYKFMVLKGKWKPWYAEAIFRKIAHIELYLDLSGYLPELTFGMLHIRDGKDEMNDKGPILNKPYKFEAVSGHKELAHVTLAYDEKFGFQYKCYVDFSCEEAQGRSLLTQCGFENISLGSGVANRLWFTLPDKPTYTTADGFLNNYYYPQ